MSERRNIAAWTPPGGVYPAYISINADAVCGKSVVTVSIRERAGTDLAAGAQATIVIPQHDWADLVETISEREVAMTLRQFLNGVRVLWNIDRGEYLACINSEDREHFGHDALWQKFRDDPHRAFSALPEQDQERIFAVIQKRNAKAGL